MKIKKNFYLTHFFLVFILLITTMVFLSSRYTVYHFDIGLGFSRIFTILLYGPFALLLIAKCFFDLQTRRYTKENCLFYVFIIYYISVTIYRLISGLEAKESLYYTITFLGVFSFIDLCVLFKDKINFSIVLDDLCVYSFIIVIYRVLFMFHLEEAFGYSPINENIIVLQFLILVPILSYKLNGLSDFSAKSMFYFITLVGMVTIVLTLGSRAGFYLLLVEIGLIAVFYLKCNFSIIKHIIILICALFFVMLLYLFNISNVRDSINRQIHISVPISEESDNEIANNLLDESTADANVYEESDKVNEEKLAASNEVENQIKSSDSMRMNLINMSIEQVKINPLFGTGDLYYEYVIEGFETFSQTAHNVILETLNCYGIFGMLLIFLYLFYKTKALVKRNGMRLFSSLEYKIIFLILFVFSVNIMVQPLGYDVLTLPLAVVALYLMMFEYGDKRFEEANYDFE